MELNVIRPYATDQFDIVWLELNTPTGNYVVQPGHAPIILILTPDQPAVFRLKSGKQESVNVRQGIADIGRDYATLIINESL